MFVNAKVIVTHTRPTGRLKSYFRIRDAISVTVDKIFYFREGFLRIHSFRALIVFLAEPFSVIYRNGRHSTNTEGIDFLTIPLNSVFVSYLYNIEVCYDVLIKNIYTFYICIFFKLNDTI